ncbi:mRNA interferase YafQ [Allofrancisella inopinata]|uniref:Type II toxin-antitoxin system mRNA interferase toxin, RelE/StbE family n=1 Tax=Allofrancisella inopinata TaxID=1085647 RepID=A0AAE6YIB6_9GAMM|nr:type II toxin-antitoxin system mRNA interferase toxin, RelE/StbE family [Allofrancisella inopinata]QIV96490.1 type II toxin-antitoxin system mRNA interferase toxin, RelE/StbE family [Allofrancisella inopinata]TDT68518.1 mRNA interferase YafQ [Allofrancisella inopinata]
MLEVFETKRFLKSYKKIKHKKKILEELQKAIKFLITQQEIPKKYKDHELKGKFSGIRELHLGYDDLLLYFVINEEKKLVLVDIGTHAHTLNI